MSLLISALLLIPSLAPLAAAQPDPDRPVAAAARVESGAVRVDGRLDDDAWAQVPAATGFTQRGPNPGEPASERTEARILYDDDAIYVGMRMHDSHTPTTALGRRDDRVASDYASVVFDSYGDDRTAFQFETNPSGVQRDFLFYDDVREDRSWDAVWSVQTSQDADGWTAEFRIPLSQLRYAAGPGEQAWGVQFTREIRRLGEHATWAPIAVGEDGWVSRFGDLSGLSDLRAPRRLEIVPYLASAVTRAPGDAADPFYATTDAEPRLGADVKLGVTSDITLTATVNPDFGQVEADPAQVNLGGFELFFQERRPFFVEGLDVFSLEPRRFFSTGRPTLLYTRRIGRSPQRSAFVPDAAYAAAGDGGSVYTDAPGQTTILGAAKLSGRAGGVSFGVLNAVTSPEFGRYRAFDGAGAEVQDDRALIEPATNYSVGRARATLGQTRIGGLFTSVLRSTRNPDIASLLPRQAYVGGLDVEHPLSDNWVVNAQLAGSLVEGSPESIVTLQTAFPRLYQRPDAGHLALDATRTTLTGLTGELNVLKVGGEHWGGSFHASFTSPGFDSNALGFQGRADEAGVGGVIGYNQNEPQGIFRRWGVNVFSGVGWNLDGDRRQTFVGGNVNFGLKNFWGGGLNWSAGPRTPDDRLTRGGPLATDPAGVNVNLRMGSDDRKALSGYAFTSLNADELGGGGVYTGLGAELRPASNLTLRLGPEVGVSTTARQYLDAVEAPQMTETFGTRYLFAEVEQRSVALEARADWTFSPDLSLQIYARPFVATGQYSRFQQLGAPGQLSLPVFGEDVGSATTADGVTTIDPGDGSAPLTYAPDFTFRALQGNAVLRWQYRPGSTLFFVWQQQRSGSAPDGDLRFGRDVRGLFADDLTNVFLVKLSYWLG